MHPTAMTPDELAATGRALYGERWQTALAQDLQVADRTMRRWVSGDSPIPDGVRTQVREILGERIKEIGGLIGYSINPADKSVFHYPTAAYFRYPDDMSNVTLLNPQMIDSDKIPLITQGAEEALRQERERDPRIQLMFLDRAGRPAHKIHALTDKLRIAGRLTTILDQIQSASDRHSFRLYTKPGTGMQPERHLIELINGNSSEEFDISPENFERLRVEYGAS